MRILRSLVSIFLVTTLTYMIIYTLTPRNLIFKMTNYNKVAKTKDSKINYENTESTIAWVIWNTWIQRAATKSK